MRNRKKMVILISCLLLSGTIIINAQEILVAIGKGDLPEVKKLVERDPQLVNSRFHKGHASNFGKMIPDGKYFFFLQDISLYWVDASFIEDLRKEVPVQNNKPNKLRKEK